METVKKFVLNNDAKLNITEKNWKSFNEATKDKSVILVGAGEVCKEFLDKYTNYYNILAILDNAKDKQGKDINGIKIISANELKEIEKDFELLIVSTRYNEELKLQYPNAFSILDMEVTKRRYDLLLTFYKIRYKVFSKNGIWDNYVIFTLKAIFRVLRIPWVYSKHKDLCKIKNIHKGKRAFIIGTGPSLRISDVEKLTNEITFSMNGIFNIYKETAWRPMYYLLSDPEALPKYLRLNSKFNVEDCCIKHAYLSDIFRKKLKASNKLTFIPVSYLDHLVSVGSRRLKYSHNLLWGHYSSHTVTNMAINLAEYMGIKEIYLLGVDCNYSGKSSYFDGSKNEFSIQDVNAKLLHEEQVLGYKFVNNNVRKKGVKIYNATRGGALEVFERVDFDSLFKEDNQNV